MNPWILSISVAYLLGSIPFGYLLVRIFRNEDIREQGSGNIGATNVARSGAKGLGIATLALDMGKAYVAVVIARGQGRGERAGRVPGADLACGGGDSAGVRGGVCADAVCFAGVDCGAGDVSTIWVLFCGVADADGGVWISVYSAVDHREAP